MPNPVASTAPVSRGAYVSWSRDHVAAMSPFCRRGRPKTTREQQFFASMDVCRHDHPRNTG